MSDSSTSKNNISKTAQSADKLSQVSDIDNIWLLPDGVTDLLSEEAQKLEWLRYTLTSLLVKCGYQLISPPVIEYTESLLGNASEDLKRQTFKIIDQLSGRLMGIRADITPQILRIDAHLSKLNKADNIARYCYAGHVVRTLPHGLFGSRTPLQLGAEIFGCDGLEADIELIDVLYKLLDKIKLTQQVHIDIGHVVVFERLKELAGLTDSDAKLLINLYANKALPELKNVCANFPMGNDFYQLALQGHDVNALKQVLSEGAKNDITIITALDDVATLVNHIKDNYQGNVSVDITELGYHYHTGIVFNGYFENESQALVRGGRFNGRSLEDAKTATINTSTHSSYAKTDTAQPNLTPTRSATGFSLEVTRLQRYISLPSPKFIVVNFNDLQLANKSDDSSILTKLNKKIAELRSNDERVVCPLNKSDVPIEATHQLVNTNSEWVLKTL